MVGPNLNHRLIGELLVYPSYPPKPFGLSRLNLHGTCMVSWNESLFVASGSHDQLVSLSSI